MSNLADFFNITDKQLYPPQDGAYVTGNMYGLEYSYNSVNTVSVSAGTCYDGLNKNILTLATGANATIAAPAINTVYNLFVTSDGDVQFDTDVDGATLTGAGLKVRWIGFVRTNSSGDICLFSASGNSIVFGKASENILGTSSTAPNTYDHSVLLPISRIKSIEYGTNGNYQPGTSVYSVDTSGNVIARLAAKTNIVVTSDTVYYAWGSDGGVLVPFDDGTLLTGTVTSGSVNILVHVVDIKR